MKKEITEVSSLLEELRNTDYNTFLKIKSILTNSQDKKKEQ